MPLPEDGSIATYSAVEDPRRRKKVTSEPEDPGKRRQQAVESSVKAQTGALEPDIGAILTAKNRGATLTLEEHGDIIADALSQQPVEWNAVFNEEGELAALWSSGGKREFSIPDTEENRAILKGSTVMHNHPSGRAEASDVDLSMMPELGINRTLVVGRDENGPVVVELDRADAVRARAGVRRGGS